MKKKQVITVLKMVQVDLDRVGQAKTKNGQVWLQMVNDTIQHLLEDLQKDESELS